MRLVKSAIVPLLLALAVTALAVSAVDNKSADIVDAAAIATNHGNGNRFRKSVHNRRPVLCREELS
jgi:Spy/CpxP family protein refolding chaperone